MDVQAPHLFSTPPVGNVNRRGNPHNALFNLFELIRRTLMRGKTPGFWKRYERQQFAMAASCMPRLALKDGVEPMKIEIPLAVCTLPNRSIPDPFTTLWEKAVSYN